MQQNRRQALPAIAVLGLFYFVFLGSTYFFTSVLGASADAETAAAGQSCFFGASAIGFLLFAPVNRHMGTSTQRASAFLATLLFVLLLFVAYTRPSTIIILTAGSVAFILLGLGGGGAHWMAAVSFSDEPRLARFVGISYACGVLLQFITATVIDNDLITAIILGCTSIAMLTILLAIDVGEFPAPAAVFAQETGTTRARTMRIIGCTIGILLLMTCLFGILDDVITLVSADGEASSILWPRLCLAVSGLVAGFLFDLKGRRFMPLLTVCAALLSTAAILALTNGADALAGLIVYSLASGFYVVFFTTAFLALSPRMKIPQFWSGMGRVVDSATTMIFGLPCFMLASSGNTALIAAASLIAVIGVSALFFASRGMAQTLQPLDDEARRTVLTDDEAKLTSFSVERGLTQRERQALECLIEGDSDEEIAQKLSISRSTVRLHIASILKKTSSTCRIDAVRSLQTYRPQD